MVLLVYCAGSLGKEVAAIAERVNEGERRWSEIAFIDDTMNNQPAFGLNTMTYDKLLTTYRPDACEVVVANGEPYIRQILFDKLEANGYRFAQLVDPTAVILRNAMLGRGCVVFPHASVSPDAVVGDNALLYYNSVVAHDAVIGRHTLLSINVSVTGHCHIGECVFLGAGSTIREQRSVGDHCLIGMGSCVTSHIEANKVAYGVPAKAVSDRKSKSVFR